MTAPHVIQNRLHSIILELLVRVGICIRRSAKYTIRTMIPMLDNPNRSSISQSDSIAPGRPKIFCICSLDCKRASRGWSISDWSLAPVKKKLMQAIAANSDNKASTIPHTCRVRSLSRKFLICWRKVVPSKEVSRTSGFFLFCSDSEAFCSARLVFLGIMFSNEIYNEG